MGDSRLLIEKLDFLNQNDFKEITNLIDSDNFAWYFHLNYHDQIGIPDVNDISTHGFTHTLYGNNQIYSNFYDNFLPICFNIQKLFKENIVFTRMKINMTLNVGRQVAINSHIDESDLVGHGDKWKTAIYYINDSDGDTLFFDGKQNIIHRQTPKANTLVVFDGNTHHAPQLPNIFPRRLVINYNFLLEG